MPNFRQSGAKGPSVLSLDILRRWPKSISCIVKVASTGLKTASEKFRGSGKVNLNGGPIFRKPGTFFCHPNQSEVLREPSILAQEMYVITELTVKIVFFENVCQISLFFINKNVKK